MREKKRSKKAVGFPIRLNHQGKEKLQMIRLTERDRDLFLSALEKDVRPNRALCKAAELFKRFHINVD